MANVEIILDATDNISAALESIQSTLDGLVSNVEDLNSSLNSVDVSGLDSVDGAASSAASQMDSLSTSSSSASGDLSDVGSAASSAGSEMGSAAGETSALDDAMSAVAGVAVASALVSAAEAAGSYGTSMARLQIVAEQTGQNMGNVKASISSLSQTTGRTAGSIRSFYTQMGIAGVNSTSALKGAFQGLSSAAFVTGNDINTVSSVMQKMVLSGKVGARQLTQLGLSTKDMAAVMGVSTTEVSKKFDSMSANQRTAMLSMALNNKYGTKANEAFKNSWDGVLTQLQKASDYIVRLAGSIILPVLVPAIQAAVSVLQVFGGVIATIIDGPLGIVVSVLGTAAAGFLGLALVLPIVTRGIAMMKSTLAALNTIYNLVTTATIRNAIAEKASAASKLAHSLANKVLAAGSYALTAARNSELLASVGSTAATIADRVAKIAASVATHALAAATWILNAALSANPIAIVVIALTALVAGLLYAYNNVTWFRDGVNQLWSILQGVAQFISGLFAPAVMSIGTAMSTARNLFLSALNALIGPVVSILSRVASLFTTSGNAWRGILVRVGSMAANALRGGFNTVLGFVKSILSRVASAISSSAGRFASAASGAARSAVSAFRGGISGMSSAIGNELSRIGSRIWNAGSSLASAAAGAARRIVSAFKNAAGIHSPGYMAWAIDDEMGYMQNFMRKAESPLAKQAASLANSMTSGFDTNMSTSVLSSNNLEMNHSVGGDISVNIDLSNVPDGTNPSEVKSIVSGSVDNNKLTNIIVENLTRKIELSK